MSWELAPEQSTGCLPVDQGLKSLRHPMLPGDVVQADRLWHRQRREPLAFGCGLRCDPRLSLVGPALGSTGTATRPAVATS